MNAVIQKSFERLHGLPCWGLEHHRQLNLSMSFGDPALRIREPHPTKSKFKSIQRLAARRLVTVKGKWWLWIWCSHWQLSSEGVQLATGSASNLRIERALSQLAGQRLISVQIEAATGKTRFSFDLGCTLECRRFEKEGASALWYLYEPHAYVLAVHGNGCFRRGRGSKESPLRRIEG